MTVSAAATDNVNAFCVVCAGVLASANPIVTFDEPAVVGVPEIVAPLSVRPAGRVPVTIDHV